MGHSQASKSRARERILAVIARAVREDGTAVPAVGDVMKRAGLTHGGFYKHFTSRADLVRTGMLAALGQGREKMTRSARRSTRDPLRGLVSAYLSKHHRDDPGDGCALVSLGADIARADETTRRAYGDTVAHYLDLIEESSAGRLGRADAVEVLGCMVGTVLMARAVEQPELADELLDASSGVLGDRLAGRGPGLVRPVVASRPAPEREVGRAGDADEGAAEAPHPRRGRPRDSAVEQRILAATLQHLAVDGLTGMTIDAVADTAGVGKPSIYRRWATKADMAMAAVATLAVTGPAAPSTDLWAALAHEISTYAAAIDRHGGMSLVGGLLNHEVDHPEMVELFRERVVAASRDRVRSLLERGQAEGRVDPAGDTEVLADLLLGYYLTVRVGGRDLAEDWPSACVGVVRRAVGAGVDAGAGVGVDAGAGFDVGVEDLSP
ncbi:MAG: TetR/AcrR family transcriptional regulator [Pseudonocardia sp.]